MSVGADSLMGSLNMSKLLDKETLERGRVTRKQEEDRVVDIDDDSPGDLVKVEHKSHNLQIGEVIDDADEYE